MRGSGCSCCVIMSYPCRSLKTMHSTSAASSLQFGVTSSGRGEGIELYFVRTREMAADQITNNDGLQVLVAGKNLMGMIRG